MAKTAAVFKAYDLRRKQHHIIPSPPTKIHQHRVDKREWKAAASRSCSPIRKGRAARKSPRQLSTAVEILKEVSSETACLHCGRLGDEVGCGMKCYRAFAKENFLPEFVDIKGPGPIGYGAYTKPNVHIKKGQWIGEYIGDLHPLDLDMESRYKVYIPGKCIVDAEKAGNWTRFINSNCCPNLQMVPEFVGKRSVLLFLAKRDIAPEEELTFKYGKRYFEAAGFDCACSSCERSMMLVKGKK